MQLTLVVPELVWPEPDDHEAFDTLISPALNTLLARSHFQHRPPQSLEATLTDAFALPPSAPYAPFRLLGEQGIGDAANAPGDACWLCADPVHLRFHQERLILADSSTFEIALDEARAICDELNRQFSDLGSFLVASSGRWYLRLANLPELGETDVAPLSVVAGRSLDRQLPQARWLRRLLNEVQMVLHAHPINEFNKLRENSGRLPINSLWLWGAGTLPQRSHCDFDGVWSNHPLAVGLGRASGVLAHALPADAATLLAGSVPDSQHLVLLEDLLGPVHYENSETYRNALQTLETRWFMPLRQALASGKVKRLRIKASTAYGELGWESRPVDQWKLWRRAQPLATLAQNLANGSATSSHPSPRPSPARGEGVNHGNLSA
jgi:hypothetical protein